MEIKDSGARREFETGAVRDIQQGKGRMDLLPWMAIMEVSKHCEKGALKYGEHNVDKGIPTHSFADSAFRHLGKYLEGMDDEPHLIAAAWNLLWMIETEINHPELKDIPFKPKEDKNVFRGVPDEEFFKDNPYSSNLTDEEKVQIHKAAEMLKTRSAESKAKIMKGLKDE